MDITTNDRRTTRHANSKLSVNGMMGSFTLSRKIDRQEAMRDINEEVRRIEAFDPAGCLGNLRCDCFYCKRNNDFSMMYIEFDT